MKIAVISDTHGQHEKVIVPQVDLLIHCGDISNIGTFNQINSFLDWFININVTTKIFIAGNRDFLLENHHNFLSLYYNRLEATGIIYLRDRSVEINGIKIYGSPMSPQFGNWAFMANRGKDIKRYWDKIPPDTEILITHTPPAKILDLTNENINAGCEDLLDVVTKLHNLKYHLFGHIHEGRGTTIINNKNFINATCVDQNYTFKYQPYEFEIETKALF